MNQPIQKLRCDPDNCDYAHDIAKKVNEVIDRVHNIEAMLKELSDYPRIQSLARDSK